MIGNVRWLLCSILSFVLIVSPVAYAADTNTVEESPSALAMTTDLVVVRPVMFATTVVGSALWLVGLPFSAIGGNVKESADTLVVEPAKMTFYRCLGCTSTGRTTPVNED